MKKRTLPFSKDMLEVVLETLKNFELKGKNETLAEIANELNKKEYKKLTGTPISEKDVSLLRIHYLGLRRAKTSKRRLSNKVSIRSDGDISFSDKFMEEIFFSNITNKTKMKILKILSLL